MTTPMKTPPSGNYADRRTLGVILLLCALALASGLWIDAAAVARLEASSIKALRFPLRLISNFGEKEPLILIFLTLAACRAWVRLAVTALAAAAAGSIASSAIKAVVGRVRPGLAAESSSFPSGHAVVVFTVAFVLAKRFPRLKYAFYGAAFVIALTRVLILKHFPSDVLAGGALGLLVGLAAVALARRLPDIDALRWPRCVAVALLIPLVLHLIMHSGKVSYVLWIVAAVTALAAVWIRVDRLRKRQRLPLPGDDLQAESAADRTD